MKEPRVEVCCHCDFGSGHRGMDTCGKCDGTGSQLVVGSHRFPNTKKGYEEATAVTCSDTPDNKDTLERYDAAKLHIRPNLDTIPLVYVMSPYYDRSSRIRMNRFRTVEFYTSRLMRRYRSAMFYSPIAYCHPIAEEFGLPTDFGFWREHDECMIARSQLGIVLRDNGWEVSEGIAGERGVFELFSIPYIFDDVDSEHEVVGQALQELA